MAAEGKVGGPFAQLHAHVSRLSDVSAHRLAATEPFDLSHATALAGSRRSA